MTVGDGGYAAARSSVVLIDRSDRARIALAGPDRAKVLHNLTTNDIKRLPAGRGREAFLTSPQGKIVAWVLIHAEAESLLIRADPAAAGAILGHLGKYGVFEDATSRDVSAETAEWHLLGPGVEVAGLPLPDGELSIGRGEIVGRPVRVIRESPAGLPGLTVVAGMADAEQVGAALREIAATELSPEAFEALRIEAGTPAFGRDIAPTNLPQEINRDARAISFVKGCYLGQETVARLDALGHVNKILVRGVVAAGPIPRPGALIRSGEKEVGVLTSTAYSPAFGAGVFLAVVKVAQAEAGTSLIADTDDGPVDLVVGSWPLGTPA